MSGASLRDEWIARYVQQLRWRDVRTQWDVRLAEDDYAGEHAHYIPEVVADLYLLTAGLLTADRALSRAVELFNREHPF